MARPPRPPRPARPRTAAPPLEWHAVILAGGSGVRLWPLSRQHRPKQLLPLFDGKSLLQLARARLAGLFPPERIWVVTAQRFLPQVAVQLPDLPPTNLIGEPAARNTANAILLAAHQISSRAGDTASAMAVFTADHVIRPQNRFAASIRAARAAVATYPGRLLTFGVRPTCPHTGYGYLRRGPALARTPAAPFAVAAFHEKPDAATARRFLRSGRYYWNSGMFAWRTADIRAEFARQHPQHATALAALAARWQASGGARGRSAFAALPGISIDHAVLESAPRVMMLPLDCDWVDVGSWDALAALAPTDRAGNAPGALADAAAAPFLLDCERVAVFAEGRISVNVVGGRDLVIVTTDDAVLICDRAHSEKLKALAELRRARAGERYE